MDPEIAKSFEILWQTDKKVKIGFANVVAEWVATTNFSSYSEYLKTVTREHEEDIGVDEEPAEIRDAIDVETDIQELWDIENFQEMITEMRAYCEGDEPKLRFPDPETLNELKIKALDQSSGLEKSKPN